VAGIHQNNIWLDIVVDFETHKPNLKDIQKSYYQDNGLEGEMVWKNSDMISKFLTDNEAILVEARSQNTNVSQHFMVNIRIINKIRLAAASDSLQPIPHVLSVSFSEVMDAGFSLLEAYPNSFWEVSSNSIRNHFWHDNTSNNLGILLFDNPKNRVKFGVTLGIWDNVIWSDVYFLTGTEYKATATDVHATHYNDFKHILLLGEHIRRGNNSNLHASDCLEPLDPSSVGNSGWLASVCSHAIGSSRQYQSDIRVRSF
ncbi:hypothetical protein BDP27DRAFT_1343252, partial [Rhodocollybia butyracea]